MQTAPADLPRAAFVAPLDGSDQTITLKPGSVYTKTWSLKNVGPSAWPAGTKLTFLGGSVSFKGSASESDSIVVPSAPAGDIVHVSIDIVVPDEEGRYRGTFRLQTADGYRFGPRIWLDFTAANETAAQPTATATATANANLMDSVVMEQKYEEEAKEAPSAPPGPVPAPAPASAPVSELAVAPNGRPVNGGYIYSTELSQLAAMGFEINADIATLLEKYAGNVDKVVNALINSN